MCLRSTDRLIDELYVQPLSPPDARTVLLPESDNCRAYTPAIQRPIDRSSSECSTYYHYLMLAPHCHQNWHLAALPAAAYLGITILYFHNLLVAYLGTTILCFHNLLAAYSGITILWFYFIIDWFYFILFLIDFILFCWNIWIKVIWSHVLGRLFYAQRKNCQCRNIRTEVIWLRVVNVLSTCCRGVFD